MQRWKKQARGEIRQKQLLNLSDPQHSTRLHVPAEVAQRLKSHNEAPSAQPPSPGLQVHSERLAALQPYRVVQCCLSSAHSWPGHDCLFTNAFMHCIHTSLHLAQLAGIAVVSLKIFQPCNQQAAVLVSARLVCGHGFRAVGIPCVCLLSACGPARVSWAVTASVQVRWGVAVANGGCGQLQGDMERPDLPLHRQQQRSRAA